MPFAELRVRVPDLPGELRRLAGVVAAVGADIVNVDVQHVHDGHAIDVLSVRLPEGEALEAFTAAMTEALGGADVECRWAGRDALTDPMVRALDVVRAVASRPGDVTVLERGLCRLLDAEQAWIVPTPPARSGWVGQAVATGLPTTRRSLDVRCGTAGAPTSLLVLPLPAPESSVAIVARPDGAFTDSEVARGMALGRTTADMGAGHPSRPPGGSPTWDVHEVPTRRGGPVVVRPAVPEDRAAVLALHARCSDTTLHRRFFAGMPILHRRVLDTLVGDSPDENVALVAEDTEGHLRAIANVIRTPDDTTDAEIALLVEDDWQNRGLGSTLLALLRHAADQQGWRWLAASTLVDNDPMRHLLSRVPGSRPAGLGHGAVRIELPAGRRRGSSARPRNVTG